MTDEASDLVVIRTFSDSIAAHIAQAALDANDIQSIIIGDDAGGAYPALAFSHGVRLAVKHFEAVRALRLLDSEPSPGSGDDALTVD